MPTEIKPLFGTAGVDVTITLASLANATARESTAWDWSPFDDILLEATIKGGASGVSASGVATVYAYATVDDGATYTEGATGTDGSFTMPGITQLFVVGVLFINANGQTRKGGPWSVGSVFGGTLPAKGGVIVLNETGAAFDATGSNHHIQYQGVTRQVVTT
jgi:hypothetical protein